MVFSYFFFFVLQCADGLPSSLLTIKGAPDILIERCTSIVSESGRIQPLTADTLRAVKELKDQWSADGKRVILLARKVIPAKDIFSYPSQGKYESEIMAHAKQDLVLVGLVGIVDPPREEIPGVIKTLRRAGIRIFMVGCTFQRESE